MIQTLARFWPTAKSYGTLTYTNPAPGTYIRTQPVPASVDSLAHSHQPPHVATYVYFLRALRMAPSLVELEVLGAARHGCTCKSQSTGGALSQAPSQGSTNSHHTGRFLHCPARLVCSPQRPKCDQCDPIHGACRSFPLRGNDTHLHLPCRAGVETKMAHSQLEQNPAADTCVSRCVHGGRNGLGEYTYRIAKSPPSAMRRRGQICH